MNSTPTDGYKDDAYYFGDPHVDWCYDDDNPTTTTTGYGDYNGGIGYLGTGLPNCTDYTADIIGGGVDVVPIAAPPPAMAPLLAPASSLSLPAAGVPEPASTAPDPSTFSCVSCGLRGVTLETCQNCDAPSPDIADEEPGRDAPAPPGPASGTADQREARGEPRSRGARRRRRARAQPEAVEMESMDVCKATHWPSQPPPLWRLPSIGCGGVWWNAQCRDC